MTDVLVDIRRSHTAVVRMNGPGRDNTPAPEALADLRDAIGALDGDDAVEAIVLTGTGSVFCAGIGIDALHAEFSRGGEQAVIDFYVDIWWPAVQATARALWRVSKPLVAAVNGAASGIGLDFALTCDARVATTSANLSADDDVLGMLSVSGGACLLPDLIGVHQAIPLLVAGTSIEAGRARALGLVDTVCDRAYLMSQAIDTAERLARGPAESFAFNKRISRRTTTSRLEEALSESYSANVDLLAKIGTRRRLLSAMERYAGSGKPSRVSGHSASRAALRLV